MTQDPEERARVDPDGVTEDLQAGEEPFEPGLEQPEADIAEQRRAVEEDEEFEPPVALPAEGGEGDVLDQRRIIPPDEDDYLAPE